MHCERVICCTGFHFDEEERTCSLGDQTLNNYHRHFGESFYTNEGKKKIPRTSPFLCSGGPFLYPWCRGWRRVRHVPQRETWHPANDELRLVVSTGLELRVTIAGGQRSTETRGMTVSPGLCSGLRRRRRSSSWPAAT